MIVTTPLENEYFYHIYNRGNNRENIFKENENYTYFLSLITKHILAIADVYCYCLLSNHFHLLVRIKEAGSTQPEQSFSNLFNAYAKSFNKKYNRTGKLFEERFKRKKITDDSYFTALVYYIHANPQKHQLIKNFSDYPYSSYSSIISTKRTALKRDEVLEWFGGKELFEKYHSANQSFLTETMSFEDF